MAYFNFTLVFYNMVVRRGSGRGKRVCIYDGFMYITQIITSHYHYSYIGQVIMNIMYTNILIKLTHTMMIFSVLSKRERGDKKYFLITQKLSFLL